MEDNTVNRFKFTTCASFLKASSVPEYENSVFATKIEFSHSGKVSKKQLAQVVKFLPIRLFVCFTAIVFYSACTNNEKDFANPLDPDNFRTAGSPIGLTLAPDDGKVTVSWQNIGNEGIAKYRIYRHFTGDLNLAFELVGEVEAPTTTFTDEKNIINAK